MVSCPGDVAAAAAEPFTVSGYDEYADLRIPARSFFMQSVPRLLRHDLWSMHASPLTAAAKSAASVASAAVAATSLTAATESATSLTSSRHLVLVKTQLGTV